MSREMALNVFGVFISIVVVAFSVDGSTADSEAEYLYFYSPLNSDVIINPGSKEVLTVLLNYLDSDLQPVVNPVKKDVSVTFTLSDPREGRLCLSEKGDEGTKTTDCSSFSVTIQNTTESLSLVISYSPPVDEAFIEKDKVFHLDVSSNDLHNPTVKLQPITITTRDSRRLQVGFSGVLHRRFMEGSNLTVKQFNTSQKIASKLDVNVSIFEPADGESRKFKANVTIQQLKEETNWTIPLPSYLDRTKSYLLNLSTELTKVHLSPCELRVYPSEQEVKCAELADDVRSLVEDNTQSLDQVNTQSLDQVRGLLIDMCDVIKEGRSYTTTTSTAPTTSPPPTCPPPTTSPPPTCPSPPTTSPPPTSPPPTCPPTTCPPTTCPSPPTTSPPSTQPVTTTQDTTSAAEATPTTLTTSPAIPTSQGNNENPSISEESTYTAPLEVQDRAEDISVMWWVFFVFLALLILGVSGYLLFNHHAKVKVYLFQLVGKGGSTVSASHRSRSATTKYTPLPTNVQETMLHQDQRRYK